MEEWLPRLIDSVTTGSVVGGGMLWLVRNWLTKSERKRESLEKKVDDLGENRMRKTETGLAELAKRVADHERGDASREILLAIRHVETDIKRLEGLFVKMDAKLDAVGEETGRQAVRIEHNTERNEATGKELKEHIREGHNHA